MLVSSLAILIICRAIPVLGALDSDTQAALEDFAKDAPPEVAALMRRIFADYDGSRFSPDDRPINVSVSLLAHHLYVHDRVGTGATARFLMIFYWSDSRLTWRAADYGYRQNFMIRDSRLLPDPTLCFVTRVLDDPQQWRLPREKVRRRMQISLVDDQGEVPARIVYVESATSHFSCAPVDDLFLGFLRPYQIRCYSVLQAGYPERNLSLDCKYFESIDLRNVPGGALPLERLAPGWTIISHFCESESLPPHAHHNAPAAIDGSKELFSSIRVELVLEDNEPRFLDWVIFPWIFVACTFVITSDRAALLVLIVCALQTVQIDVDRPGTIFPAWTTWTFIASAVAFRLLHRPK